MKITFLVPPPLDGKLAAERIFGCNYGLYQQPNIFILYPATMLKEAGHQVKVKDFSVGDVSEKAFNDFIENDDSDVYVFYTVFLSKKTDIKAKDIIREKRKGIKFVYMGTEPTANPKDFIDAEDVFVIRGETELVVADLMREIDSNKGPITVNGVSFFNKKVVNNPSGPPIEDLDKVSIPDRTLIDHSKYYNPKFSSPFTIMLTSRGCFGQCIYCVPNSQSFAREIEYKKKHGCKPRVRMRSAENVIKELKILKEQGYKSIYFVDDQFVWDEERMIKIMKALGELGFSWGALARADMLLNENIIKAMGEAGCEFIDIGVESFNQAILDDIKKGEKVEMYYEAVALLKKYNIEPEINVLLGASPFETKETIKHTLAEVKRLNCRYVLISICTPFPHTEFNKIAKEKGWMVNDEYQPLDPIRNAQVSYPHLTKEELEKIIKNAYKGFYFRPRIIIGEVLRVRSFNDFVNKFKTAWKIFRM